MLCCCRSHTFTINQPLKIPGMLLDSSSCLPGSRERTGERSLQGGPTKCRVVFTKGQVVYILKLLDILELELKNLALKRPFPSLAAVGKCIVKACLSQVFVCDTNFSLCFYCRCSPCTFRQYQLCTFMYSQIGSVQITLHINHSVGTCTKHY